MPLLLCMWMSLPSCQTETLVFRKILDLYIIFVLKMFDANCINRPNGIEPPTCCTKACSPGPANSWGPSPPGIPWVWTTMARVRQKTNTQRPFIVAGDFSVVMQVLGGSQFLYTFGLYCMSYCPIFVNFARWPNINFRNQINVPE